MKITNDLLNELAKKYFLNSNDFQYIKIKNFLKSRYFIIYGRNQYYFEIDKNNNDLNNFFPYFGKEDKLDNIEAWAKSIKLTLSKHSSIVKDLKQGAEKRLNLKKKYKI